MSSWVKGLVYLLSALVCVGHLPAPLPTINTCIFDDIEPPDVLQKRQTYAHTQDVLREAGTHSHIPDVLQRSGTYSHTEDVSEGTRRTSDRTKRNTQTSDRARRNSRDLFQPLRITTWFHNIGSELGRAEQDSLRAVVQEAVGRITRALAVVPVQGPLVLGRNFTEICKFAVAANQPNAGKCSVAKTTYRGEICIAEFLIPDEHLEGFATWADTGDTPVQVLYTDGAGVADTDYILYVTAATTTRCQNDHSILAYASYCQLDQNNRPTAGYTNFCPVQLQGPGFDRDKFVMTAIHELLHALGFSKQLYGKFKDCSSSADPTSCPDRRDVVETRYGMNRITTPTVLNRTQQHFRCSWTDFGGPLEDRPTIPGYSGLLECPPAGVLCRDVYPPPHTTATATTQADNCPTATTQADNFPTGNTQPPPPHTTPSCVPPLPTPPPHMYPPPLTTATATTQADNCPTGRPDDTNEEVTLELTFPALVASLTPADLSVFRDLVAMETATLACISRNRVALRPEDQPQAQLVLLQLSPAHSSTQGPGCAGVFAHLEAVVRAGGFVVTFQGTVYRASAIRMVDGKPVQRPPAAVAVVMGVVGGLLLLVLAVVLIFFCKAKTPRTVAPETASRASSITLQRF
uniref:Leishmanolysin-like peptidase n=1 Tax=Branchiostoma floridae TaxID=7739 RepID=C3XZ96_BRAFL|eukprot:XP_002610650.1 hypothetical protein BRAFLDRAFT_117891 [Branchiostoma floridae]